MAIIKDLILDQGSVFAVEMFISTGNETNTPFNLTNCTFLSEIRKYYGSSTIYGTPTITIVGNPSDGHIIVSMNNNETSNIPAGRYIYDIYVVNSSNQRFRVIEGLIIVNPGSTNTTTE